MLRIRSIHGLDLLVAPGQAQLGLLQRRPALEHVELEAGVLVGGLEPHQGHVAPGQLLRGTAPEAAAEVHDADDVVDAALLDHPPQGGGMGREYFGNFDHSGFLII